MPIYEYSCEKCGTRIDVLQKMDEPAPATCAHCNAEGTMARQVSRTSFVLKGGGWYSDLYGSSKKDAASTSTPATSSTTSTTPATPAATDSTKKDTAKKDSGGSGNTGGSSPPASGGTPSSSGGTSGSSASKA